MKTNYKEIFHELKISMKRIKKLLTSILDYAACKDGCKVFKYSVDELMCTCSPDFILSKVILSKGNW